MFLTINEKRRFGEEIFDGFLIKFHQINDRKVPYCKTSKLLFLVSSISDRRARSFEAKRNLVNNSAKNNKLLILLQDMKLFFKF